MEYCDKMYEIKNKLISQATEQLNHNLECVDTNELGEVVDMIKDIAEYERNMYEACYYKSVTEAMHGYEGRRGYVPMELDEESDWEYLMPDSKRRIRYNQVMDGLDRKIKDYDDRYGRSYNEYRDAKRHYTESHSMTDKNEMDQHAREHVDSMISSMREIWEEADPELRRRMKDDMTRLLNEMA